jgi:hypothetical protein
MRQRCNPRRRATSNIRISRSNTIGTTRHSATSCVTCVDSRDTIPILVAGQPQPSPSNRSGRLDGWKEIASYLGKDPRTAQRWELNDQLPVFREGGKVFAKTADLDRWRAARVIAPASPERPESDNVNGDSPSPSIQAAHTAPERRYRIALILAPLLLIGGTLSWLFWPLEAQIQQYTQITRDGRMKEGHLFVDRNRIYFNEFVNGKVVIASVSADGGNVTHLHLPVDSAAVAAISPARHSLLVKFGENRLAEYQVDSSSLNEISLPPGVLVSAAAWDAGGALLAVSGENDLTIFEPGTAAAPYRLRFAGAATMSEWDPLRHHLRLSLTDSKTRSTEWLDLPPSGPPHRIPRLSPNPVETGGAWSADGRFFAFEIPKWLDSQIWVADTFGSGPPRAYVLTRDAQSWRLPTFLPGAYTLVATAGHSQGQLVKLNPGRSGENKPVLPGVPGYELDYSRDGQWIAYTLFPQHTIWRCRADGADARQLTPSGLEAHQPHWSPDGTRIAFMGKRAGDDTHWRIYNVSAPGGALDELLPEGDDQGVPTWLPDGRSVVFGDLRILTGFDRAAIHELDLQTRTVSAIPAPIGMWSPRVSPSGRYLAAVSYDNKSLYIRDNQRQSWRKCATMDWLGEPVWPRDSSWVQFIGIGRPNFQAVYRISPACDQPKLIVDLPGHTLVGNEWVGVAPDDSALGLVAVADEIYKIEWRIRRRMP